MLTLQPPRNRYKKGGQNEKNHRRTNNGHVNTSTEWSRSEKSQRGQRPNRKRHRLKDHHAPVKRTLRLRTQSRQTTRKIKKRGNSRRRKRVRTQSKRPNTQQHTLPRTLRRTLPHHFKKRRPPRKSEKGGRRKTRLETSTQQKHHADRHNPRRQ